MSNSYDIYAIQMETVQVLFERIGSFPAVIGEDDDADARAIGADILQHLLKAEQGMRELLEIKIKQRDEHEISPKNQENMAKFFPQHYWICKVCFGFNTASNRSHCRHCEEG